MNVLDQLKAIAEVATEEQRKPGTPERKAEWMQVYMDAVSLRRRLEKRLEEADWPHDLDDLENIDL